MKALVECDGVKLRITLNERLMGKTLLDAVVQPYLNAFNQKTGAQLSHRGLIAVEVDGRPVDCATTISASVLHGNEPRVLLVPSGGMKMPSATGNGSLQGFNQMMASLGGGAGAGGNADMASAMEAMKGMDPAQLAGMMKSG